MKLDILMQDQEKNKISDEISKAFESLPKKAYFFFGTIKDTGFKILEDEIIDTKAKLYFAIGIDKRNTTRIMLDELLRYTKDVYYYSNNKQVEFDSNIMVFEYQNESVIYQSSGNISESDMSDNFSFYTKIVFDLKNADDKSEYKTMLKGILKNIEKAEFELLTSSKVEELVEQKEIFSTRQYVHNVKSIAELLGSKKEENQENDVPKLPEIEIPKVDLSSIDLDIDIDLPEEEISVDNVDNTEEKEEVKRSSSNNSEDIEVEIPMDDEVSQIDVDEMVTSDNVDKNNDLYDEDLEDVGYNEEDAIDINSMLFSKSDMKLELDDEDEKEEEKNIENDNEIIQVKKINLNAVTNFIYELPSKASKGQEASCLKIPNYIVNMIPEFFELNSKGKNVTINDCDYKVREIKVEIVDVKNNEKYLDREAKFSLRKGQSFMNITSEKIKNIDFKEKDIARIIKLASDIYHIEIIPDDMQEYKLWDKLCTQKFKSTDRTYGMM